MLDKTSQQKNNGAPKQGTRSRDPLIYKLGFHKHTKLKAIVYM